MAAPRYIDDFLHITRWHATLAADNAERHPAPDIAAAWQIVADALNDAADKIRDMDARAPKAAA